MDADMTNGLDGETQEQYQARLTAETLARYSVAAPEQLPVNLQGLRFTWLEAWGNNAMCAGEATLSGLSAATTYELRVAPWLNVSTRMPPSAVVTFTTP